MRAIVLILALALLGSCSDLEGLWGGDAAGADVSDAVALDPADPDSGGPDSGDPDSGDPDSGDPDQRATEQEDPATAPPAPEDPAQEEPAAQDPAVPEVPEQEAPDIETKSPQQIACERGGGLFAPVSPGSALRTCLTKTRDFKRQCTSGSDCEGVCLARSRTCAPVVPLLGCNEILLDGGTTVVDCIR